MKNKSIMWDYIAEEPEILEKLMDAQEIREFAGRVGKDTEAIYFVAHGSSYNAALAVSDFLSAYGGVRVYVYTPANFRHNAYALQREEKKSVLVAAISQTGPAAGWWKRSARPEETAFVLLASRMCRTRRLPGNQNIPFCWDAKERTAMQKQRGTAPRCLCSFCWPYIWDMRNRL